MAPMWRQEHSWDIQAPPEQVWGVIQDVNTWDQWLPGLGTITGAATPIRQLRKGAKFYTRARSPYPILGEVQFQEVLSPQVLEFTRGIPGLKTKTRFTLEPRPGNCTRVNYVMEPVGWVTGVLGRIPGVRPSEASRRATGRALGDVVGRSIHDALQGKRGGSTSPPSR